MKDLEFGSTLGYSCRLDVLQLPAERKADERWWSLQMSVYEQTNKRFMEIEDFFMIYQNSAWGKDITAMINLYDEHAVIFDMWDQGYNSNTSEWIKIITDWLGSLGEELVKVEFEMVKIHQSGDIGFASALIQFKAISSDGVILRSMKNRITLGFLKFGDEWKVTHQHTSAPISSNGLTAILDI